MTPQSTWALLVRPLVALTVVAAGSWGCSSSSSGGEDTNGTGDGGGGSADGAIGDGATSDSGSGSSHDASSSDGGGAHDSGSGSDAGSGSDSGPQSSCTMAAATCVSDNQACNVGSQYDLYDNQWNCGGNNCGPESAYACLNADGTTDFVIDSSQPAGNTAVLTYPAMQLNLASTPSLSSLTSVTSTFTLTAPAGGSSNDWEVAYDLWFNDYHNEFMVWVFNNGQTPAGSKVASSVSVGGKTYDVWWSPNGGTDGTVSFVLTSNVTSGPMDLLALFTYGSQNGWLPASSVATQFDFGVEVCSTDGQTATWTIADYSMVVN